MNRKTFASHTKASGIIHCCTAQRDARAHAESRMRHRAFARTPVASNGLWRTASPPAAFPSVLEFALALAQNGRHANNERLPPSAAQSNLSLNPDRMP